MIQKNTVLSVIDNSGVLRVRCIHVYHGYRKRYAKVGDLILVSLLSVRRKEKTEKQDLKKGGISKAIVLRTKTTKSFKSNNQLFFKENSVALLNNKDKFAGTRVFGVIPSLLRKTRYLRLIKMSSGGII